MRDTEIERRPPLGLCREQPGIRRHVFEVDESQPVLPGHKPSDIVRSDRALGNHHLADAAAGSAVLGQYGLQFALGEEAAAQGQRAEQRPFAP